MEGHVVHARRAVGARLLVLLAACGAPAAPRAVVHAPVPVAAPYRLGALAVDGAPAIDAAIASELAVYARAVGSRALDVSADGKTVLVADGSELVELGPGGRRDRGEVHGVVWAAFAPDGGLYVDAGDDDDALRLLWLTPDGDRVAIAPRHDARQASPVYDADSDTLVWAENRADADGTELWRSRPGGDAERVLAGSGTWEPIAIRGDVVVVRENRGAGDAVLHEVRVGSGSASGSGNAIGNAIGALARDGRLVTGDAAVPGSEVDAIAVAADGTLLATANADGASVLYAGRERVAAVPDGGVISDLHAAADAPVIAFTYSDARHPRTALRYDLTTHVLERLVKDDAPARTVDVAHVRAGDVPMLVMRPGRKAPVVLDLHGGPEDQWRPRFQPFEQFLVSRGYAVVMPNVRGSSGYGRAYAAADDGGRRADVLADVRAALDWIVAQPDLDADRVVVLGTSYGGYLALSSLIAFPIASPVRSRCRASSISPRSSPAPRGFAPPTAAASTATTRRASPRCRRARTSPSCAGR